MKIATALILTLFFLTNCGVTIKSVADREAYKEPYKNPLIVIPYEAGAVQNFCIKLKEKIELQFQADSKKVEITLYEIPKKELSLNTKSDIDDKISNSVRNDNKDLVIIFKPTHFTYSNGGLQSATYEVVAIDTKTKKEVWKSELNANGSFGLSGTAEKSAESLYGRLLGDGVI